MTARSDIQPQLLRKMTVRRVLEVLQERGASSRADLTRHTGISAPTVSKAVATLLESGLLEEGEFAESGFGRPGRLLRPAVKATQVIGVVLDARRCSVSASGMDGRPDASRLREFTTPGTYDALLDQVAAAAAEFQRAEGVRTLGVGISTPGLVHHRRQEVVFSPNLHQTNGRSPAEDLRKRLGVECVMVQEAHGLCLAERMHGEARGMGDFAMLDVSTGLGLGVLSGGQIVEGHSGLAGELGHITIDPVGRLCGCGNHGCLETLATDSAFAALVSEKVGRPVDFDEAVALTRSGRIQAAAEINRTVEFLAIAVAAVINLFNPATVFVHGRLLGLQDGLFGRVVDLTRRRALGPSFEDCRIVQAKGSKTLGAIAGIIQHLTDALGPSLD
jgi:N-acetylglucosamine repressor